MSKKRRLFTLLAGVVAVLQVYVTVANDLIFTGVLLQPKFPQVVSFPLVSKREPAAVHQDWGNG